MHLIMNTAHRPEIAFLGTGAIGVSIARALYLNRVPFTILARDRARLDELLRDGIRFRMGGKLTEFSLSMQGDFRAALVSDSSGFDYVFLGMKTPHLHASLENAWKVLTSAGRAILLQNGLPEDSLNISDALRRRIISGIVGYNVQLLAGQIYYQSNQGHLIFGAPESEALPEDLRDALETHMPIILTHNADGYRWNKLAINCVINGLGATSGQPLGPIFASRPGRQAAIRIIEESCEIMMARNVREEVVPGGISVFKFGKKGRWPLFLQHLVLRILGLKYSKVKTSMLQDIEGKRSTEVNEIQGAVVNWAVRLGHEVPVLKALVEKIKLIEAGKAQPDPANLIDLASI